MWAPFFRCLDEKEKNLRFFSTIPFPGNIVRKKEGIFTMGLFKRKNQNKAIYGTLSDIQPEGVMLKNDTSLYYIPYTSIRNVQSGSSCLITLHGSPSHLPEKDRFEQVTSLAEGTAWKNPFKKKPSSVWKKTIFLCPIPYLKPEKPIHPFDLFFIAPPSRPQPRTVIESWIKSHLHKAAVLYY